MVDVPGGDSGLLVRDDRGKEADRLVTRIDSGVVSLLMELRGHERQAAEELGQGKTRVEERKTPDASPAAMTLAVISGRTAGKQKALALTLELEREQNASACASSA